ncbi:hypothetical protein [Ferroplasma acidarmanus]|jgi:hypothetical protein|nr:hypothetical protein [Ferroplasma acidarmanus]HIH60342.1 hypothetical protein [Ferroplasma sp.]
MCVADTTIRIGEKISSNDAATQPVTNCTGVCPANTCPAKSSFSDNKK